MAHVDVQAVAAGHARLSHAARDDRSVRRCAALRGQHAARRKHAVHVVRVRLDADQNNRFAGIAPLLGRVGVENGFARRRSR